MKPQGVNDFGSPALIACSNTHCNHHIIGNIEILDDETSKSSSHRVDSDSFNNSHGLRTLLMFIYIFSRYQLKLTLLIN